MKETLEEAAERHRYGIPKHNFTRGVNWENERIYKQIKELYDNENITGFSKLAYAKCLDIVEQFKKK